MCMGQGALQNLSREVWTYLASDPRSCHSFLQVRTHLQLNLNVPLVQSTDAKLCTAQCVHILSS